MVILDMPSLKQTLDKLYEDFNFKERLRNDPIEFPHRYSNPLDIEVAGFIASAMSYGKIGLFKPVIERILAPCGRNPHDFLLNFNLRRDSRYFKGISYRFSKEADILCLIYMVSIALRKWDSLKNLFYHYYKQEHEDIRHALTVFIHFFLNIDTTEIYGKDSKPRGLTHFFPIPEKGSACKRMNLFLRWMVRRRDIDLGLWQSIPPSKLIIPLDTHIARIARCLGLTKRMASDWGTALEVTGSLRVLDQEDPLKYDFALCHYSIARYCKGERLRQVCSTCILYDINHT